MAQRSLTAAAAALVVTAALAACGGSSPPPGPPGIVALARQLGCAERSVQIATQSGRELFTAQNASCTIWKTGREVDIATFATPAAKTSWVQADASFGGVIVAQGPLWAAAR